MRSKQRFRPPSRTSICVVSHSPPCLEIRRSLSSKNFSIGDSHSPTSCASVCVQSPTPLAGCRDLRFLCGRGLWTIVLFVEPSFLPHRVCAPWRCQAAKDSVSAFSTALEPSNPKNKVRRAAAGGSRAYLQDRALRRGTNFRFLIRGVSSAHRPCTAIVRRPYPLHWCWPWLHMHWGGRGSCMQPSKVSTAHPLKFARAAWHRTIASSVGED